MKIGVFVGSFNPVHKGHIKIVEYLLEKYLDKVIVIATGNYWNKTNLVDIKHRINMLKNYQNDKIIIDEINNDKQYTYEILENLKKQYPKDELYLILGADNIINFDKWYKYKYLLEENLIIINRDNINIKEYLEKFNKKDKFIITETLPNIMLSSTQIRKEITEKNYNSLNGKIDDKIIDYILKNNLYN